MEAERNDRADLGLTWSFLGVRQSVMCEGDKMGEGMKGGLFVQGTPGDVGHAGHHIIM